MKAALTFVCIFTLSLCAKSQSEDAVFTVNKKKGLSIKPEPVGMASGKKYTYQLLGVRPNAIIKVDFDGANFFLSDTNTITFIANILLKAKGYPEDSNTLVPSSQGSYVVKNYCPKMTIYIEDSASQVLDSLVRMVCIIPYEQRKYFGTPKTKYPNWKVREDLTKQSLKKPD